MSSTLTFGGNTAIGVPVGNTVQQPSGSLGMIRYNTDSQEFMGYSNEGWGSFGGGGSVSLVSDVFQVESANQTIFTLSSNVSSAVSAFVHRNGLCMVPNMDYTITSNNILTMSANCNINDLIEARLIL